VLVSEVLSTQIRKYKEIEGFQLPRFPSTPMMPPILLKANIPFATFCAWYTSTNRGSGAKLNTSKSEAMWLGRWRANGASPFGLNWVSKVKILGSIFLMV